MTDKLKRIYYITIVVILCAPGVYLFYLIDLKYAVNRISKLFWIILFLIFGALLEVERIKGIKYLSFIGIILFLLVQVLVLLFPGCHSVIYELFN